MRTAGRGRIQTGTHRNPELRRTTTGAIALLANSLLEIAAGFGLSILLARRLGIERFGLFNFALAWSAVLTMVADAGLTLYVGKRVAEAGAGWSRAWSDTWRLKVRMNVFILPILVLVSLLHPAVRRDFPILLAFLLGETIRGLSVFTCFAFRGLRRAVLEPPVLGGERLLLLLAGTGVLLAGFGLPALAAVFVGARLLSLGLALRLMAALRRTAATKRPDPEKARPHLARSMRLGMYLVGDRLLIQGTTVLLMLGAAAVETGLFQAAYKIVMVPTMLSAAFAGSLLGPLAAARRAAPGQFARLARTSARLNTHLMLAGAACTLLWAPRLIAMIYGPGWAGAVPVLRVLCLHFLGFGLYHTSLFSLMALDEERLLGTVMLTAATIAGAATLAVVPAAGALGAAWVLAGATWALNAVFGWRLARRGVDLRDGRLTAAVTVVLVLGTALGRSPGPLDALVGVPLPLLLAGTAGIYAVGAWGLTLSPADRTAVWTTARALTLRRATA